MPEHCWHEKAAYNHHGLQCCHCGVRWWDGLQVQLKGHGRFAPKSQALPLPNKPCAPDSQLGKQGRTATENDVDFELVTFCNQLEYRATPDDPAPSATEVESEVK